MSQVQNLLDLFHKSQRDAQAPAADGKSAAKAAPAAGKSGRGGGDLLPPGADPKGNPGTSHSTSSFRDRMEKSKSKLAAKNHAAKPNANAQRQAEPARPDASRTRSKSEAADPRNDDPRQTQAARGAHAGHTDRAKSGIREKTLPSSGSERGQARKPESDGSDASASTAEVVKQPRDGEPVCADGENGLGRGDADAIKAGLDKLGIQVEDSQLDDPAFLMEMLRLLQAMPIQASQGDDLQTQVQTEPLEGTGTAQAAETAPVQPDTEIMPDAPVQVPVQTQTEVQIQAHAQTQAQTQAMADAAPAAPEAKDQVETPKALSRKELARLVEGRIADLESAAQHGKEPVRAEGASQNPTVTPKEWQGVQARPHAEGPSPDPLPMADLDRLRVLQAAAAQSAAPKDQTAGVQTDFALESDSLEPAAPTAAAAAESGQDSTGTPGQGAQSDLNGQGGDHTAGAAIAAPKDGAQAAKGGDAGPQFHHALDQARAAEHRPPIGAGAEPRAEAHGAAVLEQIARKLTIAARKPGDEISIQLSPEHLGKVRVSLEMKAEGMSARIAVENESVRKQVESNLASLKDALKDQGIQLQGLEVSVDQRHGSLFNPDGSNAESFFRQQGRGEAGGRGGLSDEPAPLDSAPESDTGRRWGYNTMEYIG